MASNKRTVKLGVFYRSQGRWVGPYKGVARAASTWNRQPFRTDLSVLKNYILKSRIALRPVG